MEIDFLPYQKDLKFVEKNGKRCVFDPIRRRFFVLTPEELLRQMILQHLLQTAVYPSSHIRVETGIEFNGMKKRCDIVVFDKAAAPWLLIECKSPKVAFNKVIFEQVAMYNMTLQAPFLVATNGLITYCCSMDYEQKTFSFLDNFPDFLK